MKKQCLITGLCVVFMLGMTGCRVSDGEDTLSSDIVMEDFEIETTQGNLNEFLRYETSNNLPITDNNAVYAQDDDLEVVTMYLTVQQGREVDGTNHTWQEVNQYSAYYYDTLEVERYMVEGILQIGDENGPIEGEYGYYAMSPNVTVSIRGQTSTNSEHKNYKISIMDGKGSYKNQKVINLNKHSGELLRYRNKLCFDLMEELPGMMSARTQFVHLYVRDLTQSDKAAFVDYGLYTQVEQINKTYLESHGLDKDGHLYKINLFEFYPYEDVIMLSSDADYDEKAFEEFIEIKGDADHAKLIRMLEELNDMTIPIEETFSKWFDEENVFSWLAFHILMGNKDTQSRNVFIYSPLNVDKWYFISWDNDGALFRTEYALAEKKNGLEWENGISNYWGNVLFRRVLKSEDYRQKLHTKIEEYRSLLTEDRLQDRLAGYESVVYPFISRYPDIESLNGTLKERQTVYENITSEIEINCQEYLASLEKPMPFFIGIPSVTEEGIYVNWDVAYSFSGDFVTYTVELDDEYTFDTPIYRAEGVLPGITIPQKLEAGKYYIRIKATDESGDEQYAFDYYLSDDGKEYGIKSFYFTRDGQMIEETYIEE